MPGDQSDSSRGPLDEGIRLGDPMHIGIGLHTYQDSWSHEGYGGFWGHWWTSEPDEPWHNIRSAERMAKATYEKLAEYTKQCGRSNVTWEQNEKLRDTVIDLLKAPADLNFRSEWWHKQIKKDFPGSELYFESGGPDNGWTPGFLRAAERIFPGLPPPP